MRARPHQFIPVIASIAGTIVAIPFLTQGKSSDAFAQRFTVATATRGDVVRVVNAVGQLSPMTTVEISSQISGQVTEVNADFNSVVRKGEIVARIDTSTFRQNLRQAEADLAAATAVHSLSVLNSNRLRMLWEQSLVPKQVYDEAEAQLQQSNARLLMSEASVERARLDIERCTIRSPIDGIVIYRDIEIGKTVISSLSAPTLFTIAHDLSKMRMIAPISEVDIGVVRPGLKAGFTVDAFGEREFSARLLQIRNPYTPSEKQNVLQKVQSAAVSFDAVFDVDNADLILRPSLSTNVRIVISQRENAIRIPNGALKVTLDESEKPDASKRHHPEAGLTTVYRLQENGGRITPEAVVVRLGISDSGLTEIISGLEEGDRVITGIATPFEPPDVGGVFF